LKESGSHTRRDAERRRQDARRTGKERRGTEPQLRDLIENPLIGVYRTSIAGAFLYANETMAQMLGFASAEALMQENVRSFYRRPDDRARLVEILRADGRIKNFETELRSRSGEPLIVLMNATLAGETISGVIIDITARKRVEITLLEEKNKTEAIIAGIGDGISIQDLNFRVLYQNRVHQGFIGEHTGKLCYEAYEHRDAVCGHCPVARAFRDGGIHMVESISDLPEGRRYYEITASPLRDAAGAIIGGIEVVRDVTARRLAEEALREERNFIATILDTVGALVLVLDPQGRVVRFNKACERTSGFTFDELRGRHLWDHVIPPEEIGGVKEVFGRLTAGMFPNRHVNAWLTRDGQRKLISWNTTCLLDEQGAVKYVVPTGVDITEQDKAEAFVRNILETVDEGFLVIDRDLRVRTANRAVGELLGRPAAQITDRTCDEIARGAFRFCGRDCDSCAVTRTFTSGQPQTMVESNQSGLHTMLFVQIKTFPLRDHAGQVSAVIVILNDISTQKRLEAQLLQSQKMEAIGLLAGGVAHDFNNILSAIIGYASILQMKIPPDAPLRPNVDQVLAAAQRAASLTQGLLAFSRKQIINPKPLEVNDRVRRIERLLRRIIGEDIDLAVRYASEDRTILMDAGQLEQVIINLATNARDAMPAGGVLRIETGTAAMDAEFIGRHGFGQAGHYAVITVSDTGTGMDEQTRMHIFEPFFTTKEIGKGTGLGLSTVYGIVKQNNGFILCDSEPGSGSTFRLYFPLAGEVPGADAAAAPPLAPGGSETILIAEDDEMIRDLFRMVFTDNGYQVLTAGDGDEALAEFRKHPADIDLLVIDVIMPKKNGRDLYEEVRRIRPGIKVLFTSGYTDNIVHKQGLLDEGIHFVTKPVELAAMLKRVRDILDSR
jgi:two-component system NtrC family sensor kinase